MNIEFVYRSLNEDQKNSIINMWLSAGVLDKINAQKRVEEVSCIITDNDTIVGVTTVYPASLSESQLYFFFRMFILESHRGENQIRTRVMLMNYYQLKKRFGKEIKGIALELENRKLSRLGEKTDYMVRRGYTYFGKSQRGLHVWYISFEAPKGIFLKSDYSENE